MATVIQMAHSLGLTTVAEGVESAQDIDHLRRLGTDTVQGYFIATPRPASAILPNLPQQQKSTAA